MLGEADEVIFLDEDGMEAARGTHAELLNDARYHAVVHRAAGAQDEGAQATDDQSTTGEEGTR